MGELKCIIKSCEWYNELTEQNCGGACNDEPAIASCEKFEEIEPYLETIESQAKEIKGLTKALEDKESNMYRLFHDFLISDSCWVTDKAGNDLPDAVIDGELKKFVLAKEQ